MAFFLDCVPLPEYEGLRLAVTATRALERFGDICDGQEWPATLTMRDRIDIIDDCLDVVCMREDAPAGFEFAGISLAQLWRALLTVEPASERCAEWRTCLLDSAVQALREAARARVDVRATGTHLRSHGWWIPSQTGDRDPVEFPTPLERVMLASDADWQRPRRSRSVVEIVDEVGTPGRRLFTRGKRWTRAGMDDIRQWLRAEHLGLVPQTEHDEDRYWELQLCLPSMESSYFGTRHQTRNVFARLRASRFVDNSGHGTLLLNELSSHWMDELCIANTDALPARHVVRGKSSSPADLPPLPACPVAGEWLEIALEAFLERAENIDCRRVAWIPGRIQHELDPGAPLAALIDRYDREIPEMLAKLLNADSPPGEVGYATYRRNVMIRDDEVAGFHLTAGDGVTQISERVDGRTETFALFRSRAEPVVEQLPAFDLWSPTGLVGVLEHDADAVDHSDHWSPL